MIFLTQKTYKQIALFFTLFVTIAIFGLTLWDYFHGGVPGHHLLKRKDLPEISNWWGLISIPLVTYISLKKIEKRINFEIGFTNQLFLRKHIVPLLIAFVYGILIVIFSSTGNSSNSYSMFLILFCSLIYSNL